MLVTVSVFVGVGVFVDVAVFVGSRGGTYSPLDSQASFALKSPYKGVCRF